MAESHPPVDPGEARLNKALASIPLNWQQDDAITHSLVSDLARGLYSPTEVAERYGVDMPWLHRWLQQPEIMRRVKRERGLWQSDASASDRARTMFALIAIEAAPVIDKMIHDPLATPTAKLDAFKTVLKASGLESVPKDQGNTGPTASQFAVNITFSGGEVTRITTVANPPEIEGEAA